MTSDFEQIAKKVMLKMTLIPEFEVVEYGNRRMVSLAPVLEHCLLKRVFFQDPEIIRI